MLYIGKAKDPFTEEIFEWKIEASDYFSAKNEFDEILLVKNPFFAHACDSWVEIADEQSESEFCFLVQAAAHKYGPLQKCYVDTLGEAVDIADDLSRCCDYIEILYGWPGHWETIEEVEDDE